MKLLTKISAVLLAAMMAFSFCSCSNDAGEGTDYLVLSGYNALIIRSNGEIIEGQVNRAGAQDSYPIAVNNQLVNAIILDEKMSGAKITSNVTFFSEKRDGKIYLSNTQYGDYTTPITGTVISYTEVDYKNDLEEVTYIIIEDEGNYYIGDDETISLASSFKCDYWGPATITNDSYSIQMYAQGQYEDVGVNTCGTISAGGTLYYLLDF